jgi:alkanesulfonate monooxygenase SsuD/methylene tetrahydromethanopterin reductase-like flavin-dependent oxidoreductase (luciferase family)
VGVLLPSRETVMIGRQDAAGLVDFARRAEDMGFDSVWTGDSPLARPRADPFSLLGAVAAATSRITIGTAALTATLRHPVLGAHAAATVDQISNGRLVLGLGAGFPTEESRTEFAALGVPFERRVGRLDETVRIWRRGWSEEGADSALPPARAGGPPLWLASGDTPRMIDRTAEHYDGWLPFLPDPGAYARAWEQIRRRAGELGRHVTPALYATVNLGATAEGSEEELDAYVRAYYRRPLAFMSTIQAYFGGTVDDCLRWLGRYIRAGARHLVLRLGTTEADGQLEVAAERLLPALRAAG